MNITMERVGKMKNITSFTDNEIKEEFINRFRIKKGAKLTSARNSADHLMTVFAGMDRDREHFVVVFLDGQHNIIKTETLFSGTITTSAVFPREIIKKVLEYEAASIIVSHNHPSGCVETSSSDKVITTKLHTALKAIDVDLLDHIIIGNGDYLSFADKSLL